MRTGKVKSSVYDRSIMRQLHSVMADQPVDARGAAKVSYPEDGKSGLISKVFTVEGKTMTALRTVTRALSQIAAARAITPVNVSLMVLLPKDVEEPWLKGFMRELADLCQKSEVLRIADADARVSLAVQDVVVSVSLTGRAKLPDLKKGQAKADDKEYDLIVAGEVAAEGTALLTSQYKKQLLSRYPNDFLTVAEGLLAESGQTIRALGPCMEGARYGYPLGEGGVFAGFWDLAAAIKVGLDVSLKKIPIRQHTIEVCEFFKLNPYMLISTGSFLIVAKNGAEIVLKLREMGIAAEVVGRTNAGNDRIIRYDDEVRYLEPPKADEYIKVQE